MALGIETFSNLTGGDALFKALGHPLAAAPMARLLDRLAGAGAVALYDPLGALGSMAELYDLGPLDVAGVFVQDLDKLGRAVLGRRVQPVTELNECGARAVLVTGFDAERLIGPIRHLLPDGAEVVNLDEVRLEESMLTNRRRYLDPMNFATNFVFFRDADGHHTRLSGVNYWAGYGARDTAVWFCLFDADGDRLAEWRQPLAPAVAALTVDSRAVRDRFGLGPFTGQLFMHVIGGAGHDVVKYALDTYGDAETLFSCTHDANAWPADLYAGLPAPKPGERIVLWVQNSHPCPIPPGAVGLNLMGSSEVAWLDREVAGFASYPLDVASLLPAAGWPQQIEVRAGKHFVRPRYEILWNDEGRRRSRVAHMNVERIDLKPDPGIKEIGNLMGKGYLLPAPVLPPKRFRSIALPTPMATTQQTLPVAAILYDASGKEVGRHRFGCLKRSDSVALDAEEIAAGAADGGLMSGYGHMELIYDFTDGGDADGWLHAIFRYEDKLSGHAAETSFGAHVFNTVLTYRGEPQSYAGRPPGLSTRLFLRIGREPLETVCHLIYPASTPWHGTSDTKLILHHGGGEPVATRRVHIPCSGSLMWRHTETFDANERRRAGDGAYVVVRDVTCRLFGYHGLENGEAAFSFDHMFGF
ncbi:MAG: hypothetical protein ACE5JZ_06820 [Kiloniellales bacterium]